MGCGGGQGGEISLVWGEARWAGERSRRWGPFMCQVVLFFYWLVYIWLGNQGLGPPGFIYYRCSCVIYTALVLLRCLLLITSVTEHQEFEGCSRVPALGMF